jgi:hypothetical protein
MTKKALLHLYVLCILLYTFMKEEFHGFLMHPTMDVTTNFNTKPTNLILFQPRLHQIVYHARVV